MAVTTTTQIDPTIQPFLSFGLGEAQRLYQAGGPQYFPGQTFVSPSETTLTGLQALEQRATAGSPLMGAARGAVLSATQGQQSPAAQMYADIYGRAGYNPTSEFYSGLLGGTVNPAMAGAQATASGQYLSGNPFFQGAFAPAAQAATQQFQSALGNIASQASRAGRYGSGAMERLQGQASNQLAQQLANTAGQLAYQNYGTERALQEAAMGRVGALSQQDIVNRMAAAQGLGGNYQQAVANQLAATGGLGQTFASDVNRQLVAAGMVPQMSQMEYQDIQNLLAAGQAREGYTGQQLASDIARFNFLQNAPQQNLGNFLNAVYGNPLGRATQTTQAGYQDTSGLQNFLGTAATLGGLYKNLGGASGISNLWNTASSFFNPTPSFQGTSLSPFFFGTGTSGD